MQIPWPDGCDPEVIVTSGFTPADLTSLKAATKTDATRQQFAFTADARVRPVGDVTRGQGIGSKRRASAARAADNAGAIDLTGDGGASAQPPAMRRRRDSSRSGQRGALAPARQTKSRQDPSSGERNTGEVCAEAIAIVGDCAGTGGQKRARSPVHGHSGARASDTPSSHGGAGSSSGTGVGEGSMGRNSHDGARGDIGGAAGGGGGGGDGGRGDPGGAGGRGSGGPRRGARWAPIDHRVPVTVRNPTQVAALLQSCKDTTAQPFSYKLRVRDQHMGPGKSVRAITGAVCSFFDLCHMRTDPHFMSDCRVRDMCVLVMGNMHEMILSRAASLKENTAVTGVLPFVM